MVTITDQQRTILRERNITFTSFKMIISALLTPNDITEDQWVSYYQDFVDQLSERDWIKDSKSPVEKFAEDYFIDWEIEQQNCQLRSKKNPKENWIVITNIINTLPEPGFEILGFNKQWIDPNFNSDGIRVCYRLDEDVTETSPFGIWSSAGWDSCHDSWTTLTNFEGAQDYRCGDQNPTPIPPPTHWMNKPEPPINTYEYIEKK